MCGICGIVDSGNRPIDSAVLERMTDALRHRGPDDGGIYLSPHSDGVAGLRVGLGHRRLSIIDLSPCGRQPMCNEDGSVWISFNGEIYNYLEIKNSLLSHGHTFNSGTDTEVILHAYEEHGESVFEKLDGMFAIALWDRGRQTVYLARDRFGKKPLFYWERPGSIVFASELKALKSHPGFTGELDRRSISRYLLFEYVPAPHCIYRAVRKVPPGSFLRWRNGESRVVHYWSLLPGSSQGLKPPSETEACEALQAILSRAVRRRLMSDVPLGLFLSGGVDSSAILSVLAELMPVEGIKTFSIGFEEPSFDESPHARLVASHFGTDHHEQTLSVQKMTEIIPEVCDFLDEPFADASIIPTYLLSKFTRGHVTVALGGDGGDELFAGYDPFVADRLARLYDKIPTWLHERVIQPAASRLPVSSANMSLDFRIKQFLKGIGHPQACRHQIWLGAFSPAEQQELLHPELRQVLNGFRPESDIHESLHGKRFSDPVEALIYFYSRFYLTDDILAKIDRASMAVSLEVRSPFLDRELVEYVWSLPSRFKLNGLSRKYILKKSLRHRLPAEIISRKKKGFGIPLSQWLKSDLKPLLNEVLSPRAVKEDELFNPVAVARLLRDHWDGARDNRKQIWTLFMFQMWRRRYG